MPVRVTFERHADPDGDVYIPLFEPDRPVAGGEEAARDRRVRSAASASPTSVAGSGAIRWS